jgi:hypothetical protein
MMLVQVPKLVPTVVTASPPAAETETSHPLATPELKLEEVTFGAADKISKALVTDVAAAKFVSPPCDDVTEQLPLLTKVIVEPETVQTEVVFEVLETVNPEEELEVSEVEFALRTLAVRVLNVIVCEAD